MSADLDTFLALETQVWQALVDGDVAADERLLSADFFGVYPSGFATRDDHAGQLNHAPSVASFVLTEMRIMQISADAVMFSYRADFTRPNAPPEAMYVSSLWCHRDGGWINTFSQDTPATT